jgi:hypothetical protein
LTTLILYAQNTEDREKTNPSDGTNYPALKRIYPATPFLKRELVASSLETTTFSISEVRHLEPFCNIFFHPKLEPNHGLLKSPIRGKLYLLNRQITPKREAMFDSPVEINLIRDL